MNWKAQLIEAGRQMLGKGLTVETWGNLSLRDPDTGLIYLTPSAMPYDTIQESDVVVMTPDGAVAEGTRKPTVEAGMHLRILRARPEINAIIHTHPLYSLVFGVQHREIPPIIDEAAQVLGGTVRVADYALPGTEALAENAQKALGSRGMACLLANHGAVCLGRDMDQAFRVGTVLEMTAHIYQMALATGTPQIISGEHVAYMKDFMDNHYGQDR